MLFPKKVDLVEICPRDGLQNFPKIYDTDTKIEMVNLLSETGVNKIEVSGFVHPKVIPQLADAEKVFKKIKRKEGVIYRGLVPNKMGANRAIDSGVGEMLALICCSETYNKKNQNMTIKQSIEEISKIIKVGKESNTPVTVAIAISFYCPYEGRISEKRVLSIIENLIQLGADQFYLATSTGMADPRQVFNLLSKINDKWPDVSFGLHLHNRNGMALANVLAALQAGITTFEGAALGLGGGIRMVGEHKVLGNVPFEDLLHLFNSMNVKTGISLRKYLNALREIENLLGHDSVSSIRSGGARSDVIGL